MLNTVPRVALLAECDVTHRTMKMHASLRHKTLLIMQVTRQVLTLYWAAVDPTKSIVTRHTAVHCKPHVTR